MSTTADVDTTLAALADPTRRAVVALLCHGPRRPSEIAELIGETRPAISRHLRVLRLAGLVSEESRSDDARARVYTLHRAPFAGLRGWLDEVEAFWHDQLRSFKAHAERKRRR